MPAKREEVLLDVRDLTVAYESRGGGEKQTEFANGVAAMCSSGIYGKTRVCAGIVGHADLMLGSRVERSCPR